MRMKFMENAIERKTLEVKFRPKESFECSEGAAKGTQNRLKLQNDTFLSMVGFETTTLKLRSQRLIY